MNVECSIFLNSKICFHSFSGQLFIGKISNMKHCAIRIVNHFFSNGNNELRGLTISRSLVDFELWEKTGRRCYKCETGCCHIWLGWSLIIDRNSWFWLRMDWGMLFRLKRRLIWLNNDIYTVMISEQWNWLCCESVVNEVNESQLWFLFSKMFAINLIQQMLEFRWIPIEYIS